MSGFADTVQSLINMGDGFAAQFTGQPYAWFRPIGPDNPVRPACDMGFTVRAALGTAATGKSLAANLYGKAVWYALYDRAAVQVGDYLAGAPGTFFVAAQQPLLQSVWVECNRTLTVLRDSGTGLAPVGQTQPAEADNAILTGWPASVLRDRPGNVSKDSLAEETRASWASILLPDAGVPIDVGDLATDDIGRRFLLTSVELTGLGYRITAMQQGV